MADNVAVTEGSGKTIAADDVGGVMHQRVKLSLGADGVAADAGVGEGASTGGLRVSLATDGTVIGAVNETAPANDTASAGLNGRLQRIAQRLTTLIGQHPTALGATTSAASMSVVLATDGAITGAVNETAPASDTASSGLNGRLQRIAQRITSLIALVPASLGQKAMASSFAVAIASDQSIIPVGGRSVRVAASLMTRPADTTAYTVGDLVANSTTAGSVVPLSFTAARANDTTGVVRRAKIRKSGTSLTNAVFRLHLYQNDPSASTGITNGDNGAWLTKEAGALGYIDITVDRAFSDFAVGHGAPFAGAEIVFAPASGTQTIYGLLEARGAYTPGNAETFLVTLELFQD